MTAPSIDVPRLAGVLGERAERVRRATGRSPLGRIDLVRALIDDPRWIVPLGLVLYVTYSTWNWEFPNWQGVPFPPVWLGSAVLVLGVARRVHWRLTPVSVAAIVVMTAMLVTDITLFWSQSLRDLQLYLKAGDVWRTGGPVYSHVPLVTRPVDLSNYPYLYPPVTLPLFGALGLLAWPLAALIWIGGSLAAVLYGMRRVGLAWRWCLVLLLWPPVAQGLYVGNVAVPMFALFAAAVARPALLTVAPIFKLYSGIQSLWLLRREHWRDLVVGATAVGATCLASVAVMGVDIWRSWLEGLRTYQVSQQILPDYLYGFGLARQIPLPVLAVIAVAVTLIALRARERRDQLSRLGVATVVASPSLFAHGWLVALPAMVRLDTLAFWLAFGATACAPGPGWFAALVLVAVSWYLPAIRKRPVPDAWHPLDAAAEPWPHPGDGTSVEPWPAVGANVPAPAPSGSSLCGGVDTRADAGRRPRVCSPS